MDNKPLDEEAESFIRNRLGKNNIKHAKPNFDREGLDICALEIVDNEYIKYVVIQSKGRNLTKSHSNVEIPISYVKDNFVCVLYNKVEGDHNDYLYCFFENDIKKWGQVNKDYKLYIPKDFALKKNFQDAAFNKDKADRIKSLLETRSSQKREFVFENKFSPIETALDLWKLTGGLPDYKITVWFLENIDFGLTLITHDIFLLYLGILHSSEMKQGVDYMFNLFKYSSNTDKPIFQNISIVDSVSSNNDLNSWFLTYKNNECKEFIVDIDNKHLKALYVKLSDIEESVETILIDNGDYLIYYQRNNY